MSADLLSYLPEFLRDVQEYQQIFSAENPEFDGIGTEIDGIFPEALIMECSEERIKQWEKALDVEAQGTLTERRFYIKGVLNGKGKLNEETIKEIVRSYTGGEADVSLTNSILRVQVKPPENGEVYRFEDVERTLRPLVPAHLGLVVERFYSTWGDIKNNFADWEVLSAMDDWQAVKEYIEE